MMLSEIQARLKAPKDKKNDFGGYNYRNTEGILKAFKEIAPKGVSLVMTDEISEVAGRIFLTCTAMLYEGDKLIAEAKGAAMHAIQKKGMDDAQITGACSSYARKYALCGLFAIDDSADDPDSKDNRRAVEEAQEIAHERAVVDAQVMIESAETVDDLEAVWRRLRRETKSDDRVLEAAKVRKSELSQKAAA